MQIIDTEYFVILQADVGYKLAHKDDITTTYNELIMNKNQADNYIEVVDEDYNSDFNVINNCEDTKQLDELKTKYIYNSKVKLKEILKENPLEFNGKYYTVTLKKQTIFYNKLFNYTLQNNHDLLFAWHTNDNIDVKWNYNEVMDFMEKMNNYIDNLVCQQRNYEERVKNCHTEEEIINFEEVNYVY